MKLQKARFIVLEGMSPDRMIEVMFNPTEYHTVFATRWGPVDHEKQGEAPNQFIETVQEDFNVSLFFDTYESGLDVRLHVGRIIALTIPTVMEGKGKRPAKCLFLWGTFFVQGIVTKVDAHYTMFSSIGIPVRARVSVTMRPILLFPELWKSKGVEACRKVAVVREGDRLDLIAAREMDDPSQWTKIAEANDIEDPIRFPREDDIGRLLIIPDVV